MTDGTSPKLKPGTKRQPEDPSKARIETLVTGTID